MLRVLLPTFPLPNLTPFRVIVCLVALLLLAQSSQSWASNEDLSEPPHLERAPVFDLRSVPWGQGQLYTLDGLWNAVVGQLMEPLQFSGSTSRAFPVPEVWGNKSKADNPPPALGVMTYQQTVRLPAEAKTYYLYLPDMPSAYQLWANGKPVASNGVTAYSHTQEQPEFGPKVVTLPAIADSLSLVLQVSNFHYREGGIWFSLKLTDESGRLALYQKPLVWAVFFAAILIAIGTYNLSMFVFRSKEVAALYFGLLCIVVGLRRLLIDERVIYLFNWFEWETLQRLEHLCFYLALPLFMSFFAALYKEHVPKWVTRSAWILIAPFVLLCLLFSTRIYTELNVSFQVLVLISVAIALTLYLRVLFSGGKQTKTFGISLLILAGTVTHDVLKANGYLDSDNIAHFGILAFVISQSIALQRRYLRSLGMVEKMSNELQARNQELVELDEFKDEFLATTSHELRTPLQGISGLAKALQRTNSDDLNKAQKHKVDLIANTAERLRVLVNDILDFSSIKHGKLKLNMGTVDLKQLSEVVLTTLNSTLGEKPVKLLANIDSDCRYLHADTFRLQQVLFNLVGNAVKYTEQGCIKIEVSLSDDKLMIRISDTGVGIPKEKLPDLFKPFEQAHVEGHFSASGTGLGLSISKKLVELHGGSLEVESEIGQGTDVTLYFPEEILLNLPSEHNQDPDHLTLQIDRTADEPVTAAPSSGSADDTLVFIVDDERINRELVASLLIAEGYQTEQFSEGLGVLKRLQERCPDLILLDYMMPKMNGIEVCHSIRQHFDNLELPVMMLTARHQVSDIVAALNAGANDYLTKPFQDKELQARVRAQVSVRKHWLANQENDRLKSEITQRKRLEEQLADSHSQLLQSLDHSAEILIRVDQSDVIRYANATAIQALDAQGHSLVGRHLSSVFDKEAMNKIVQRVSESLHTSFSLSLLESDWDAQCHHPRGNKSNGLMLLASRRHHSSSDTPANSVLSELTQELNASRKRIEDIEQALIQFGGDSEPETLDPDALQTAEIAEPSTPKSFEKPSENKEMVSELLRMTLGYWEQYTGKGKVDLAELSRCWRVYVDGTTVKTRTFDKYLSARTIPDNPRWRAVVRTAHFVLAQCSLSTTDEDQLRSLTRSVEECFA